MQEHKPNEQIERRGRPKQALNAITGMPIRAMERFDTRSATEFPNAKNVAPNLSSVMAKTVPAAFSAVTISAAKIDIQTREVQNPKKQPMLLKLL